MSVRLLLRWREWLAWWAAPPGAAMAAIVMIFEMTLDYTVIVPMTLTVAISYAVRTSLIKDSIYTRKFTLRGEPVPETMRADVQVSQAPPGSCAGQPRTLATFAAGDGGRRSVAVSGDASLWDVIAQMRANDASVALVTSKIGHSQVAPYKG